MSDINDLRKKKDFRGITFSGFKKSAAKKEFLKALFNEQIEPACYWGAEFICAGHLIDIWDILLDFMSNNIHLANPKLPMYMNMRLDNFREIIQNGYTNNELQLRNNKKIRQLFAEMICIICLSKKKNSFDAIKIEKTAFNLVQLSKKLKADNIGYAKDIFYTEDPKELFISINELAYHIKCKNLVNAFYWIEWTLAWEKICRTKKEKYSGATRAFVNVESKYQKDIIWIIWHLLIVRAEQKSPAVKKIIISLLNLFTIHFTPGCKNKRKKLLFFATALVIENSLINTPLHNAGSIINNTKEKIDIIYKQVKKNECAPNTGYLFNNSIASKKTNLENTIKKLDTLKKIGTFIPRNN